MKMLFFLLIVLFTNCSSQKIAQIADGNALQVEFEDIYHYPYSLTSKDFLVIDTQAKMDDVFKIIHQKSPKGRMSPIFTIYDKADETYLIFKPVVKTTNDVQITKMSFKEGVLTISVVPVNDPQFSKNSRIQPNVLVKVLKKLNIKKVIINYLK